jgi:hypothetical protein
MPIPTTLNNARKYRRETDQQYGEKRLSKKPSLREPRVQIRGEWLLSQVKLIVSKHVTRSLDLRRSLVGIKSPVLVEKRVWGSAEKCHLKHLLFKTSGNTNRY